MDRHTSLGGISALAFTIIAACGGGTTEPPPTGSGTAAGGSSTGGGFGGAGGSVSSAGGGGSNGVCGNDILEEGEECDDGNNEDADGCEADCTLPKCNNGIVDPGEACFGGPIMTTEVGFPVVDLVVTDCNGDGASDVLVMADLTPAAPSAILVFENDGSGVLELKTQGVLGDGPGVAFTTGELDGQPGIDLAAVYSGPNTLRTFSGNGDCTFTSDVYTSLSNAPLAVATLFLDGDGKEDVVATVASTTSTLEYLLSEDGPPVASAPAFAAQPRSIAIGKLDGNASGDVAYVDAANHKVVVRLNQGGFLGMAGVWPFMETTGSQPTALAIADVDGDADMDIVTANAGDDTITFLENDGVANFTLGSTNVSVDAGGPVVAKAPVSIALGDVDLDGDPDAVTANAGDGSTPGSITLLMNVGNGFEIADKNVFPMLEKSFPIEVSPAGQSPVAVKLIDMNGDGDLDIVFITTGATDKIHVLLARP